MRSVPPCGVLASVGCVVPPRRATPFGTKLRLPYVSPAAISVPFDRIIPKSSSVSLTNHKAFLHITIYGGQEKVDTMRSILLLISMFMISIKAIGPASALCHAPNDVCEHIKYCAIGNLTDRNKIDRDRLNQAINNGVVSGIYPPTEACQRNVGDIHAWERDSSGCHDSEYFGIATQAKAIGWQCGKRVRFYCYTQGKDYDLDGLQCKGPPNVGAACMCNVFGQDSPGQVQASQF